MVIYNYEDLYRYGIFKALGKLGCVLFQAWTCVVSQNGFRLS
jgi:hypothetical protein